MNKSELKWNLQNKYSVENAGYKKISLTQNQKRRRDDKYLNPIPVKRKQNIKVTILYSSLFEKF